MSSFGTLNEEAKIKNDTIPSFVIRHSSIDNIQFSHFYFRCQQSSISWGLNNAY